MPSDRTNRPAPTAAAAAGGDKSRRVSYVEQVTDEVREDILAGRMQPGERVQIRALTQRFGISHIPVREAVRTLESEGLLVSSATNAIFVAGLALDDLSSLYEMRRLVECPLSKASAPLLTDRQIATVFELLSNVSELGARSSSSSEFRQIHKQFHRALLAPVLSHWIETVLEQLWRGSERYVRLYVSRFGSVSDAMVQHHEMAQAAAARDGDRLAALTREHLLGTQHAIERGYRDAPMLIAPAEIDA